MNLLRLSSYILSLCIALTASAQCDSMLQKLDKIISCSEIFETEKKQRIEIIKRRLSDNQSIDNLHNTYRRLYDEYESYICDSARAYINRDISLARQHNRQDWLNSAIIKKARILSTSGLFNESIRQIHLIDRASLSKQDLSEYYKIVENTYLYLSEYTNDDEYTPQYLQMVETYRDSSMLMLQPGTFKHMISIAQNLIQQRQYQEARSVLLEYVQKLSDDTRGYAVVYSTLAYIHYLEGNERQRLDCLIHSAIADIKGVIKENTALRQIAEILYERGDLDRANRYVKKSLADATFFNGRMRNMQATRMLPLIDEAHRIQQEQQYRTIKNHLIIISLLSVFLIASVCFIFRQMKRISHAHGNMKKINDELNDLNKELTLVNQRLQSANASLSEANCIKEEYIGRFIDLCSTYISETDSYRKNLHRKATTGKAEEVLQTLRSAKFIDNTYDEFYRTFDTAFLKIFPSFIEAFNSLLPENRHIRPKPDEKLNTELRIYALIRLGFNDCTKIAGFLRCSVSTIYTYRSRIKNNSLHRNDFEERIMTIGSFTQSIEPQTKP